MSEDVKFLGGADLSDFSGGTILFPSSGFKMPLSDGSVSPFEQWVLDAFDYEFDPEGAKAILEAWWLCPGCGEIVSTDELSCPECSHERI